MQSLSPGIMAAENCNLNQNLININNSNDSSSVGMRAKRKRGLNYTREEKILLLKLVGQEDYIIANKKTDSVTCREKDLAWRRITARFNASPIKQIVRDVDSLRKSYFNFKKLRRKRILNIQPRPPAAITDTLEIDSKPNILTDSLPESTLTFLDEDAMKRLNIPFAAELPDANKFEVSQESQRSEDVEENSNCSNFSEKRPAVSSTFANNGESRVFESDEVAKVKLDTAHLELEFLAQREEREIAEHELKKKSLELDIKIKERILQKLDSMEPKSPEFVNIASVVLNKNS